MKTIFITGASRGFGKVWAEAFLKRGDNVIATTREAGVLEELEKAYPDTLLSLQFDVRDQEAGRNALQTAVDKFGRIDVLINNAGYALFGAIEEASEEEIRKQMEVNFFALVWMTQGVLPIMKKQGGGHIIQTSSILGLVAAPVLGIYNASKFAVEGFSETLALEVKQFNIHITLIEPNAYSTDFGGPSAIHTTALREYDQVKADFMALFTEDFSGKPEATADAVLKLVDSENPPVRLFLGKYSYPWMKQAYEGRTKEWDEWNDISIAAHGH